MVGRLDTDFLLFFLFLFLFLGVRWQMGVKEAPETETTDH